MSGGKKHGRPNLPYTIGRRAYGGVDFTIHCANRDCHEKASFGVAKFIPEDNVCAKFRLMGWVDKGHEQPGVPRKMTCPKCNTKKEVPKVPEIEKKVIVKLSGRMVGGKPKLAVYLYADQLKSIGFSDAKKIKLDFSRGPNAQFAMRLVRGNEDLLGAIAIHSGNKQPNLLIGVMSAENLGMKDTRFFPFGLVELDMKLNGNTLLSSFLTGTVITFMKDKAKVEKLTVLESLPGSHVARAGHVELPAKVAQPPINRVPPPATALMVVQPQVSAQAASVHHMANGSMKKPDLGADIGNLNAALGIVNEVCRVLLKDHHYRVKFIPSTEKGEQDALLGYQLIPEK